MRKKRPPWQPFVALGMLTAVAIAFMFSTDLPAPVLDMLGRYHVSFLAECSSGENGAWREVGQVYTFTAAATQAQPNDMGAALAWRLARARGFYECCPKFLGTGRPSHRRPTPGFYWLSTPSHTTLDCVLAVQAEGERHEMLPDH